MTKLNRKSTTYPQILQRTTGSRQDAKNAKRGDNIAANENVCSLCVLGVLAREIIFTTPTKFADEPIFESRSEP
ncbi:MAG: hypothetical protein HZB95_11355 [Nitrosomonadales bacterium]|nr:hypothetical protein [Nitrosomonadales bacterium]